MPTGALRLVLLIVTGTAFLAGCSSQPPGRFAVTGTVTFDGRPVPKGRVSFEPDPTSGNRGPQAIAFITDGRFSTQPRKGAKGGAAIVFVEGFDGVPALPLYPQGKPLFDRYRTQVEIPEKSSTLDIVVPTELRSQPDNG
jgi:hypothetical protein